MTNDEREIVENLRLMANGLPVSRSKAVASAAADRLEQQAATIAKLPRYANGEAFVPEFDEVWQWDESSGEAVIPSVPSELYAEHGKWVSMYGHRFYPTAAECEAAERKATE